MKFKKKDILQTQAGVQLDVKDIYNQDRLMGYVLKPKDKFLAKVLESEFNRSDIWVSKRIVEKNLTLVELEAKLKEEELLIRALRTIATEKEFYRGKRYETLGARIARIALENYERGENGISS